MARDRHLIDWRFLAMLCVMLLVMVACWGFVARQKQVDSLIRISEKSTQQVRVLSEKVDAQNAAALVADRKATRERRALQDQLRRIFRYLSEQGIAVPPSLLKPARSESSSAPKAQTPSRAPTPRPRHPRGNTGTPTPSPTTGPGVIDPLCDLLNLSPCPLS